mmetsp:Transcript_14574/g.26140  ORF Transcript_14574/g.26140 Transcript_14574/m.26140 type:complete len:206 (-) Transcript_14574:261-878(-)
MSFAYPVPAPSCGHIAAAALAQKLIARLSEVKSLSALKVSRSTTSRLYRNCTFGRDISKSDSIASSESPVLVILTRATLPSAREGQFNRADGIVSSAVHPSKLRSPPILVSFGIFARSVQPFRFSDWPTVKDLGSVLREPHDIRFRSPPTLISFGRALSASHSLSVKLPPTFILPWHWVNSLHFMTSMSPPTHSPLGSESRAQLS